VAKLLLAVVKIAAGVLFNKVLVRWQMTIKQWGCESSVPEKETVNAKLRYIKERY